MSAFLGHIHHWLYRKIQLVNERENTLFEKAQEQCGELAEELRSQVWQSYGTPLPDAPLAELIDQSNIHGWLQRQINLAQSREAGFIKELLDICGEAHSWMETCYREHGERCGKDALQTGKYDTQTASGILKALDDYRLNGMPCDQNDEILTEEENQILWQSNVILAEVNWKRVGVSTKVMQVFDLAWLDGFVRSINTDFSCRQIKHITEGDVVDRFEIIKIARNTEK